MTKKYELVIWLEVHARIKTKSKLFCQCSNNIFDEEINTHICPVCSWFPGQLPMINENAINKIILTGKALGCNIPRFSKFDRKSYFYPDLPSGFQTSQYDEPVCWEWNLELNVWWSKKWFRIHRIHLENDAWKLSHTSSWTEVDLNRAWCPLMEIVTEPDFRSVEDVKIFLQELQKLLRTIDASDADMEKGQMRADVNISLRPFNQKEFGTRAEIKNMNTFSWIEKAIFYEYKRQSKILDEWWTIAQETRGWDDNKAITKSQRSKEEAADYRYFPEPDIPPIIVSQELLDSIKVPELPIAKSERFQSEYWIKEEDALIFASDKNLASYFEQTCELSKDYKKISNWILSELMRFTKEDLIWVEQSKVKPNHIAEIITMINAWEISWKIAKEIFPEVYDKWTAPKEIVERDSLKQNSDTWELEEICKKIIENNAQIVQDYQWWKNKAFWALVWMTMKETRGQANPQMVNEILRKLI